MEEISFVCESPDEGAFSEKLSVLDKSATVRELFSVLERRFWRPFSSRSEEHDEDSIESFPSSVGTLEKGVLVLWVNVTGRVVFAFDDDEEEEEEGEEDAFRD
jgi:hypothetical protein